MVVDVSSIWINKKKKKKKKAEFTESVLDKLLYPESTIKAHPGWDRRKIAVLRLVFANSVFHERDLLPVFEAEFTESVISEA